MKIDFKSEIRAEGAVILFLYENEKDLPPFANTLNTQTNGAILAALSVSRFKGREGQTLVLNSLRGVNFDKIVLVGLGKKEAFKEEVFTKTLTSAVKTISSSGIKKLFIVMGNIPDMAISAAKASLGIRLGLWRFDKYKTEQKSENKPSLEEIVFVINSEDVSRSKELWKLCEAEGDGVYAARNLIAEPANVLYPEIFVKRAERDFASHKNIEIEVLDDSKLEELGLNLILSVGQGAVHKPRLLVLKYKGNSKEDTFPLCLIGKGVCFDSGGISLKPAKGMSKMKYDMAGAAAVFGTMKVLSMNGDKVNVLGIIPLAENMPDGGSVRPGDIVKSYEGKTVEVDNTDAEGRLILADAISYAKRNYNPKVIIDIATLTGAIVVALGGGYAGLFTNNAELEKALLKAGDKSGEKLWAFPMDEDYAKLLSSDIADIKNCSDSPDASSISAAKFLEAFVKGGKVANNTNENTSNTAKPFKTKWAHVDIAGVGWTNVDKPLSPKGPKGFGVQLFYQFIKDTLCNK